MGDLRLSPNRLFTCVTVLPDEEGATDRVRALWITGVVFIVLGVALFLFRHPLDRWNADTSMKMQVRPVKNEDLGRRGSYVAMSGPWQPGSWSLEQSASSWSLPD